MRIAPEINEFPKGIPDIKVSRFFQAKLELRHVFDEITDLFLRRIVPDENMRRQAFVTRQIDVRSGFLREHIELLLQSIERSLGRFFAEKVDRHGIQAVPILQKSRHLVISGQIFGRRIRHFDHPLIQRVDQSLAGRNMGQRYLE